MNLTVANPTMTSREIADLVESRHDDVKRSIERLYTEILHEDGTVKKPAVISKPPMADGAKSANGVTEKVYLIGKRDTYVIVAQLSPAFTARLVDRWQELESASAFKIPTTFTEALRLALAQQETIDAQTAQLEAAKPAIAFVDSYVDATGLKGFRDVAKLLKVKENFLRKFLKDNKIQYELGGKWVAYAQHMDAGRFEMRAGVADNGHAYNNCLFTPKGIQWLAGEIAKDKVKNSTE